jgi:hypothetical protein
MVQKTKTISAHAKLLSLTLRPWDASCCGRFVQGTLRPGGALSRGRFVQGTHRPGMDRAGTNRQGTF